MKAQITVLFAIVQILFLSACGASIIQYAKKGDLARVEAMLKEGEDPNKRGRYGSTPLMEAASGGHLNIVKALLDNGAEINALLNAEFDFGTGAYIMNYRLMSVPNGVEGKGITALTMATISGRGDVVNLLIDRGANVEIQDKTGKNALIFFHVNLQLKRGCNLCKGEFIDKTF